MKIKILHIVSSLDFGGVETMLKNYYAEIDKDTVAFDFIVHGHQVGKLEGYFMKNGCRVYHVTPKKLSLMKNISELVKVIRMNDYDFIHIHQNISSVSSIILSRLFTKSKIIAHSHGTKNLDLVGSSLSNAIKYFVRFFSHYHFACSIEAGEFLFGRNWDKSKKAFLMYNAFNINEFLFDNNARISKRIELGIVDKFVLIYVARMDKLKNHDYLINVFDLFLAKKSDSMLVLVGDGPERVSLQNEVLTRGISQNIIFLGNRDDVNELLMASDLFMFPSISEGLGIVAIEAQISGLPIIASINVPLSAKISKDYLSIALDEGYEYWVDAILNYTKPNFKNRRKEEFIGCKYDIREASRKYIEFLNNAIQS